MEDIFTNNSASPLAIIKRMTQEAQEEKEKLAATKEKELSSVYMKFAQALPHYWAIRNVLKTLEIEQEKSTLLNIYLKNFEDATKRLNFDIFEAKPGVYDENTGKAFDVITALPSKDVQEFTVNVTISPAISLDGKVIIRGGIQVLKPEASADETQKSKSS